MKHSSIAGLKTLGKMAQEKGGLAFTSVALALGVFAGSCSSGTDRFSGDTYRLPWADAEGQMALRDVKIKTLSDPEGFEGSAAKILVEPYELSGKLVSERPRGRYIRSRNGTIIPSTYATFQAVAAYAHQEKLQEFDQENGADHYLKWPLTIGIQVRVVDGGSLVNNNAIYDGKLDALLLVPYNLSNLPIAFNGGILAHEHFHFIFQKAVLDGIGMRQSQGCHHGVARTEADSLFDEEVAEEISPAFYNAFLLRAINEGLADFWGWAYSSDISFVGRSLPKEDRLRRLDLEAGKLSDSKSLRESLVDLRSGDKVVREEYRVGRAYVLGTQYARFLRALVDASMAQGAAKDEAKRAVTQALMKSLPIIADAALSSYTTKYISPNVFLKPLIESLPIVKTQICDVLEGFHAAEPDYEEPKACVGSTR